MFGLETIRKINREAIWQELGPTCLKCGGHNLLIDTEYNGEYPDGSLRPSPFHCECIDCGNLFTITFKE